MFCASLLRCEGLRCDSAIYHIFVWVSSTRVFCVSSVVFVFCLFFVSHFFIYFLSCPLCPGLWWTDTPLPPTIVLRNPVAQELRVGRVRSISLSLLSFLAPRDVWSESCGALWVCCCSWREGIKYPCEPSHRRYDTSYTAYCYYYFFLR